MRRWICFGAAVVLIPLHHDSWLWDSHRLVWGFLPAGLLYHMVYSLAAAAVWAATVRLAWPQHLEAWADELEQGAGAADRAAIASSPH